MSGYYINVNIKTDDAVRVREAITAIFAAEGFQFFHDQSAAAVIEDDGLLEDEKYGVILSGASGSGWVSVYVDDWQDSGFLAKRFSQSLAAPVLEVWVVEDVHWGYTYYENGEVKDRFADDPAQLGETEAEALLYRGNAAALAPILQTASAEFSALLNEARNKAGQFAGEPLDTLAQTIGIPFEHIFTGYDYFFTDDPEDYGPDLENWAQFRFLAFTPPKGRETLSE